jgi:hypothetical protein
MCSLTKKKPSWWRRILPFGGTPDNEYEWMQNPLGDVTAMPEILMREVIVGSGDPSIEGMESYIDADGREILTIHPRWRTPLFKQYHHSEPSSTFRREPDGTPIVLDFEVDTPVGSRAGVAERCLAVGLIMHSLDNAEQQMMTGPGQQNLTTTASSGGFFFFPIFLPLPFGLGGGGLFYGGGSSDVGQMPQAGHPPASDLGAFDDDPNADSFGDGGDDGSDGDDN